MVVSKELGCHKASGSDYLEADDKSKRGVNMLKPSIGISSKQNQAAGVDDSSGMTLLVFRDVAGAVDREHKRHSR